MKEIRYETFQKSRGIAVSRRGISAVDAESEERRSYVCTIHRRGAVRHHHHELLLPPPPPIPMPRPQPTTTPPHHHTTTPHHDTTTPRHHHTTTPPHHHTTTNNHHPARSRLSTNAQALARVFNVYGSQRHLGHFVRDGADEVQWRSYEDVGLQSVALAAGLARLVGVTRRGSVGIMSENRPEWLIADFACTLNDSVVVGIHPHWHAASIAHVLCESSCQAVVLSVSCIPLFERALDVAREWEGAPSDTPAGQPVPAQQGPTALKSVVLVGGGLHRGAGGARSPTLVKLAIQLSERTGLRAVAFDHVLAVGRRVGSRTLTGVMAVREGSEVEKVGEARKVRKGSRNTVRRRGDGARSSDGEFDGDGDEGGGWTFVAPPDPLGSMDDVATLMYSSGTSSTSASGTPPRPKAVATPKSTWRR